MNHQNPAAEFVERARALVPALRERALLADRLMTIPQETIDDFRRAGFLKLMNPRAQGGDDLGWDVVSEVVRTVGMGCGSSAWVLSLLVGSNFTMAYFSEEAQDEFWSSSDEPLACGAHAAHGSVRETEGGHILDGRWRFASGVDHATWNMLGGLCFEEITGRMDLRFFLVPRQDYEILDDWDVAGMRGTGSKTVQLRNVFVPQHRSTPFEYIREARGPGLARHSSANYRIPYYAMLPFLFPILGMARGAIEYWRDWNMRRSGVTHGLAIAEQPLQQMRLAESMAELEAAELLGQRMVTRAIAVANEGRIMPPEERVVQARDGAFGAKLCLQAVQRLVVDGGGAASLERQSPLQQHWRDVQAACAHIAVRWETNGTAYGRAAFGQPPAAPLFY